MAGLTKHHILLDCVYEIITYNSTSIFVIAKQLRKLSLLPTSCVLNFVNKGIIYYVRLEGGFASMCINSSD